MYPLHHSVWFHSSYNFPVIQTSIQGLLKALSLMVGFSRIQSLQLWVRSFYSCWMFHLMATIKRECLCPRVCSFWSHNQFPRENRTCLVEKIFWCLIVKVVFPPFTLDNASIFFLSTGFITIENESLRTRAVISR